MRNRWRTAVLILLAGLGVSLPGWAAGDWIQWYDYEDEVSVGTVLVMESEYWLVGTNVVSMDPPEAGIVLFRVQEDGTLLYPTSYNWGGVLSAADAIVMPEGNVLFAGRTNLYGAVGSDMYMLQTDSSGQTLSEWVFGDVFDEFAVRIVLGSQGDYFVVGNQTNPEDFIADAEAPGYGGLAHRCAPYVARVQSSGNPVWKESFASEENVVVFDAAPTSSGGCYVLSTVYGYPSADDSIRLDRIADAGTIMWTRRFDEGNSKGYGLHRLDGGWLLVAGARSAADGGPLRALLMMLTATGQVVWSQTFGGSEKITVLHDVIETHDGHFVAAGTQMTDYAAYRDDVYLVCVDADGEVQWEKTVATGKHVMVEALVELDDGSFLIAGSGSSGDEPFKAMLMHVDPPGE